MLLTAYSLRKYIQNCHNIYCLTSFYFIILKTETNRYHFDTLNCFAYFTCCPFIPTCFLHNINTDCPKHDRSW